MEMLGSLKYSISQIVSFFFFFLTNQKVLSVNAYCALPPQAFGKLTLVFPEKSQ